MKKFSLISLLILLFAACEKDADIDIKEMDPVPVIEGKFSNFAPDSYFKITMSKGFQRTGYQYEPVTDAQLSVTDSQGNIINFYPDSQGVYHTTSNGVPGETYTLKLIKGNQQVTAQSTMPSSMQFVDFEIIPGTQNSNVIESKLKLYFNDPDDQLDYYMIKIYFRDIYSTSFYPYTDEVYFDDKGYNKQEHSLTLQHFPIDEMQGDYKVKLYHLNKGYVEYLNTLDRLQGVSYGGGPLQITVPGNPETNVQGGIGYFATVASDSLVKHIN